MPDSAAAKTRSSNLLRIGAIAGGSYLTLKLEIAEVMHRGEMVIS
jgi:hypothetical protein